MTKELRFWRDVEIFNIPDAPKPRPAWQAAEEHERSASDDGDEADAHEAWDEAAPETAHPRHKCVRALKVAQDGIPELPWEQARFRIAPPGDGDNGRGDPKAAQAREKRPPASYAHAIYLGVGPKQRFVDFILRSNGIQATADEVFRPASGQGWLAAFIVNADGVPLPRTYLAAGFAVGAWLLQQQRSLDEAGGELGARSAAFDERMDERRQDLAAADPPASSALRWEDLLAECDEAHQLVGGSGPFDRNGPLGLSIVIESVPLYSRDDGSLNPAPEQAAALLNSFYIDDLTTLIQGGPDIFSAPLLRYLGADSDAASRCDLLADAASLARHASAALIPAGRWPAAPAAPLALAQQAAVYQIVARIGQAQGDRSRGLMAVNGPPGTGKTTLLKDLVAHVVVERARRLCTLQSPGELFAATPGTGTLPALRADIVAGTEIVVASNNNAAVRNISFDLPFARDQASYPHADYFSGAAALIADKFKIGRKDAPWGLLAATLGARANRKKIGEALMGYETAVDAGAGWPYAGMHATASLKPWLDYARRQRRSGHGAHARRQWDAARADFTACLAEVEGAISRLAGIDAALTELPQLAPRRGALLRDQADQRADAAAALEARSLDEASFRLEEARQADAMQSACSIVAAHNARLTQLDSKLAHVAQHDSPGLLARLLKALTGVETRQYAAWKSAIAQLHAARDDGLTALAAASLERDRLDTRMRQRAAEAEKARLEFAAAQRMNQDRLAATEQALRQLDAREGELQAIIAADGTDAPTLPDAAFLALPAAERQRRSLWVGAPLDHARGELFLSALRLHEATVLATAEEWFAILRGLRDFLCGAAQPAGAAERAALWQALFFIVPVASTTLASFGRLFEGMQAESLGWVLIDEAGQAAPAAVAGALWRARRAVLVGDPLQIEPVVTAPRRLVEALGRKRDLDDAAIARWSPSMQSAQALADRAMQIGAMVGGVWTGLPLRTHRRCMSPMFELANRIAYDGQMVQATAAKIIAPSLPASCWIDVAGQADGKVVGAQMAALRRMLESLMEEWPHVLDIRQGPEDERGTPASLYVISPFRDVADACKELMGTDSALGRRMRKAKVVADAGTVHTFQGKEASIVILVLGSAPGEAGAGARNWASSVPNLLNVALTRAQQRFYVIGSYLDWAGLPYFCELAQPDGLARVQLAPVGSDQGLCVLAVAEVGADATV